MRLSLIIPSLEVGGAELLLIDAANELISQGHDVQVIVLSNKYALASELDARIKFSSLNKHNLSSFSRNSLLPAISVANELKLRINTYRSDHVIAHLPIAHFVVRIAYFLGGNTNKIWMQHHSLQFKANPLDTTSKRLLHNLTIYLSSKVDYGHIFISQAVQNHFKTVFKTKNDFILLNSVKDRFSQISLTPYPESYNNKFNIIVPGRLVPEKGHILFLQEICSFLHKNLDVHVWLIGDGPLKDQISHEIYKLGLADQVMMLGSFPNKDLLQYIYHSDLTIIPSLIEGLGIVAIESLMLNKVCIVTHAGGLPEIITDKENGIIYNSAVKGELSEILFNIRHNNLNIKFSPRQSYEKKFKISSYIKNLLEQLEKSTTD